MQHHQQQAQHQQQTNQQQRSQAQWQKQAQQLWKPAPQQAGSSGGADAAAVPVPWTSFAADDCGDDLDKDLQELIQLPGDCPMQLQETTTCAGATPAAAAGAALGPAAAAKARSSSLRRNASTASTLSTAEALSSGAVLGQPAAAGSGSSKAKRVLRIRNNSNSSLKCNSSGSAGAGSSSGTGRIVLKGSTARRNAASSQQQQAQGAAGTSLGVSKGGVQKKVAASVSTSKAAAAAVAAAANQKAAAGAGGVLTPAGEACKPLQVAADPEPSLSLLGDLDSCLSGGDAMTAGIIPADELWDSLMQVRGLWGTAGPRAVSCVLVCISIQEETGMQQHTEQQRYRACIGHDILHAFGPRKPCWDRAGGLPLMPITCDSWWLLLPAAAVCCLLLLHVFAGGL
jgi:hypothetical protein